MHGSTGKSARVVVEGLSGREEIEIVRTDLKETPCNLAPFLVVAVISTVTPEGIFGITTSSMKQPPLKALRSHANPGGRRSSCLCLKTP